MPVCDILAVNGSAAATFSCVGNLLFAKLYYTFAYVNTTIMMMKA